MHIFGQRLRLSPKRHLPGRTICACPVFLFLLTISIVTFKASFNRRSILSSTVLSAELKPPLRTILSFQRTCTQGYSQYSCYTSFLSLAEQRQQHRYIVLLVVTHSTRHLALNWCISIHRIHLHNYLMVALDLASFKFFSNLHAPVVQISKASSPTSRSEVWIRRTLLAYILIQNGFHVLISDADALAGRSPFIELFSNASNHVFDIIASPSNFPNPSRGELPDDCKSASQTIWRYQPCMGWVFLRSTATMKIFFSQLFMPNVLKYADDQIGLVCALRHAQESQHRAHTWSPVASTAIHFRNPSLNMLILPAARYVRNCTQFKEDKLRNYGIWKFDLKKVALFHCKGPNKKMNADNNGVWYLRENWSEQISSEALSFNGHLRRFTRNEYISKN